MSNRLPDYVVTGDGPRTVFLLHGAYGAKEYWRGVTAELVKKPLRVVAWDCPGYGLSPLPDALTIDYAADRLIALVDAVGGESNLLFGHSMGGLIAPNAYGRRPDLFDGVILSATTTGFADNDPEWQKRFLAERVTPILEGQTVSEYAPGLLRSMMGPHTSSPDIDALIEVVASMNTDTFRAAIGAIKEYDGRAVLPRVDAPTLLIAGGLDETCRASKMQEMADLIPDSEFHRIEDAGHYGFYETPDEYYGYLFDWLERRFNVSS